MNQRILVIDDTAAIHEDIRKVLQPEGDIDDGLDDLEALMFDEPEARPTPESHFDIDSAYQGEEGLAKLKQAIADDAPYAMAFVDMRMPPGWDGVETIRHLLQQDPRLQVVVCTAYSDKSWDDIAGAVASRDQLLILKKPFDSVEVVQLAHALTRKWELERAARERLDELEAAVEQRTAELVSAMKDLAETVKQREVMQEELRMAQKLEAVGQLAAGVAHEINTPIQYVGDSVAFLREAFDEVGAVLGAALGVVERVSSTAELTEALEAFHRAEQDAELDLLRVELTGAFDRVEDGVSRVSRIVRAMKEFSQPDSGDMEFASLNDALDCTTTLASNEYKKVADVVLELGDIPPVRCSVSELNQVFLAVLVNASHAIADVVGESGERGTITVATRQEGPEVCVSIADTGTGMSDEVKARIFDPFYTTKDVGRGTGQGLSLTYRTIVGRHQGRICVETAVGEGTRFDLFIPIDAASQVAPAPAKAS